MSERAMSAQFATEHLQGVGAEVRLPRPPGVIRRAFSEHPRAVDITIVAFYLFGVGIGLLLDTFAAQSTIDQNGGVNIVGLHVPEYLVWPWAILAVIRVIVVAAALLFRRRYPLLGLIFVVLATFGFHGIQTVATGVAVLFLLYAVPVYRSAAAGWLGYAIAVVGTVLIELVSPSVGINTGPAGTLFADSNEPVPLRDLLAISIMTALWYLAVVMLGINLGNRRRYLAAIIDRAHQLARERDQRALLAVAEERSRIAREMHDIVAHSVSVMIALSEGASRSMKASPDAAADAMHRSAETGRTALAEMRRLLGALNTPEERAELAPQPSVEELPRLVDGFRDAGIDVELSVSGTSVGDRGQDLAVYRVAQEGLTNVLRYAGVGARVSVTVTRAEDLTEIEVRDFGSVDGSGAVESGLGSGRGLAGLAERVRMFGGRIESGPVRDADGQGWRLWACLPVSHDARTGADSDVQTELPRKALGEDASG